MFYIFSTKAGGTKQIQNPDVVAEIQAEIAGLKS